MLYKRFSFFLLPKHEQKYNQDLTHFTLAVNENKGSNIPVSINASGGPRHTRDRRLYWTMKLQRYSGGSWRTIGTRTGYTSENSPSNRTFTNVIRNGRDPLRVILTDFRTSYWSNNSVVASPNFGVTGM